VAIEGAGEKKFITIETDIVHAELSSGKGVNLTNWELKDYDSHYGGKVNLIENNGLDVNFLNINGKEVDLSQYNFYSDLINNQKIILDKQNPSREIKFYLPLGNGRIVKTFTFYYDNYSFDLKITFENLNDYIINRRYFLSWNNGLPHTEENISDDNNYTRAFAYVGEELESLVASDKYEKKEFTGKIDWVAIRTKYFLASIIPIQDSETNGATIGGVEQKIGDTPKRLYSVSLEMDYETQPRFSDQFMVYLGPLDYYTLDNYDLDLQKLVMNKDWYERLFRPISLLIIPAFKFLYRFIPNYGFVIIIFSILIKLILHPLTKKSYQSMSEMQFLQPKMTELREKYKNEPQRLNKEMMKLYKEHGVNPLGGCLPMLLQMPLLFSLFIVFRSTIQLRGKPFILWINDLSSPDTLHLGMSFPLIGNTLHVLPIVMALTMIWQSKMTMTDPKQKMMVYFMPIFMVFIFYSLPSGLNLYYAVFNLLSMIQTRYIKNKMHPGGKENEPALAANAKKIKGTTNSRRKK
jgi:YidC/Oxa1 family membrane protein insertase